MVNFKTCPNGHHYQDTYEECPYCPQPAQRAAPGQPQPLADKTVIAGSGEDAATQGQSGPIFYSSDKTQIMQAGEAAQMPQPSAGVQQQGSGTTRQPVNVRKLVGWLVTYDGKPNGLDFRLYEGRNSIGFDPGCDICIDFDPAVSARHLTLLYRLGEFLFKDELSTNGTFLNGTITNEGALNDGDELRIGGTGFLFKKSIQ